MFHRRITPDLEVRLLESSEAPALLAVVEANRRALRQWLVWVDGVKTLRDAQKFITDARREYDETQAYTAGVWLRGALVGAIGHNRIDWPNRMGNPGWWLVPSAQGQGIMTQCCRVVFAHAFDELNLARLCVGVARENAKGHAFVTRLGFKQISVLRNAEVLGNRAVDHVIYGLSRPEAVS
jgi:ribosomal-protein-serine acetyltransferase